MTLYDELETELLDVLERLKAMTPRIGKDEPQIDDVTCDDLDSLLDDVTLAVQELREAVGGRRVVLHEDLLP